MLLDERPGTNDRVTTDRPLPKAASNTSPLLRFLRVVRERWWIPALTTVVCTGVALAVSLTQAKQYEASASLLFRSPEFSTALFGSSVFEPSLDPSRESTTNLQLVQSRAVARAVREKLGLNERPSDLLQKVEVEERTNSDVVDVRVRDEEPRLAASLAGEFANQYVLFRQGADRRKISDAQALIRDQLTRVTPDDTTQRQQLEDALQKLVALEAVQTGNAELIDRAEVPTVAASPQTKRDVGVALIVSLTLGLGLAFLMDLLDRRVKSSEEFEELYRVPTLVTVPHSTFAARRSRDEGAAFEPFRILNSSLGYLSVSRPLRRVLVTSAIAEEGKTTVAMNLARAVALTGSSVALVEADLRRPSLRRHIEEEPTATGLTNALVGRESIADLMVYFLPGDLSSMSGVRDSTHPFDDARGLVGVLGSGPLPPNPAELLRSERAVELFEEIAETHDFVIVDAPPLLPVADAQVLLGHDFVDACLIVARVNKTTREQARRARTILDQAKVERVGLVVSGVGDTAGGYEYYSRIDSDTADRTGAGRAS
jgi:polysaccharide biosynthesis transport protein